MRGYLWMKQKKKLLKGSTWTSHWFIIKHGAMFYYPDDENNSIEFMEGSFDVNQMASISISLNSHNDAILKIVTVQNQIIHLKGKNNTETQTWKEKLLEVKYANLKSDQMATHEIKFLRKNLFQLSISTNPHEEGNLISNRHSRSLSSLPSGRLNASRERMSQICTALLTPNRDSNFWSDVSSIGPSVSAVGSVVDYDEDGQVIGGDGDGEDEDVDVVDDEDIDKEISQVMMKGSGMSTPIGSGSLRPSGPLSKRLRSPQIPTGMHQLPLHYELLADHNTRYDSSECVARSGSAKNDPAKKEKDSTIEIRKRGNSKKEKEKKKEKELAKKSSNDESEDDTAPILRRYFMRSTLTRAKRNSQTLLGRFRKMSAPNKSVSKTRKGLKVPLTKRNSVSPRGSRQSKDYPSFTLPMNKSFGNLDSAKRMDPLYSNIQWNSEDENLFGKSRDEADKPRFENKALSKLKSLDFDDFDNSRRLSRMKTLEKSPSFNTNEKMLGILHLMEHPESLSKDDTRAASAIDPELKAKLLKWRESADTGRNVRLSWKPPFNTSKVPEKDEVTRKASRPWTNFVAQGDFPEPVPPIPEKPLRFRKKQLEKLLHGKLKPRLNIDLDNVARLLAQLTIEYQANLLDEKRNKGESLYNHYDHPRNLEMNPIIETTIRDDGVQLRPKSRMASKTYSTLV